MNRNRRTLIELGALSLLATPLAAVGESSSSRKREPFSEEEVIKEGKEFFATGAKELSDVLRKVLAEKGQPIAIIRGQEGGGAIGVGLRYGHGRIEYRGGAGRKVYWQGPSLGFDVGANVVKVFALVYDLPSTDSLFQRYPGVEGSLYFVGGFGVNYVQSGQTVVAPVRFGVGWRQGLSVGYMNFSPKRRINPF
jgi:hypothetical protein